MYMEINSILLDINEMTRSGEKLKCVKRIIIHENLNQHFLAVEERNYINKLKNQDELYYSVHFIVDNSGCVRCVNEDEVSYSTNNLDYDSSSISVSYSYDEKNGKPSKETFKNLKKLILYLMLKYDISKENVLFHFNVTNTTCPRFFFDNRVILNEIFT